MRSTCQRVLVACALSALVACTDEVVDRGIIQFGGTSRIDAPTAASVGTSFHVTVTTYGSGCYDYESSNVVIERGDTVIEPYDRHLEGTCTQILNYIPHDVTLKFDETGTKTIRIRGLRDTTYNGEVIELAITVSIN